jgi:hypothetical protein
MLDKRTLGRMRRDMGIGISKAKLSQAMLEVLMQLPEGTADLKETIVAHLGLLGQMAATRDINAAWTEVKKRAARDYPDKFILDDRKVLHWWDNAPPLLDKKISAANFKKLNELAEQEGCSVNAVVSKMLKVYKKVGR